MLTFPHKNWYLTRASWLWLLVAVGLLILGVVKNINLLTMLGCALVAMLVLGRFVIGRGVTVRDEAAGTEIRWYYDAVEAHARLTCTAEVRLPRRGWHDWGPLEAPSTHPFGLVCRRVELLPLTRMLATGRGGFTGEQRPGAAS